MTEAQIVRRILAYLKQRGGVALKIHGGPYQAAGIPDIYYAESGLSIWFEVKKPHGSYGVTKLQRQMINALNTQGVPAVVVTSVEEVDRELRTRLPERQKAGG